ncbi:helix-turn-helix domain-containing protein [Caulobacter sp. NIBR2454]|uniref:helix-turn-helix domain-containing protein n=1 Tax=Caulobacter sp. NIBR2454 TaxID=3015996 RepID=UPI0022B67D13|nr:helix-turn-helix domain-containing protein [Caulobacter sp. NIBR2454]
MSKPRIVATDPPGTFIKLELDARGWSQRDLAFILGQAEQQLNPLLSGKRTISPDMARLLGDAFGVPPQFFANLQSQYDLANAKEPDPAVRARAELQSEWPVRDMIRRGWIEQREASLMRLEVARFFEAANDIAGEVAVPHAAKKTHYGDVSPQQLAWLFRVRQLARQQNVAPFSLDELTSSLPRLKSLMIDPEAVKEVPSILASCGVRLVVVEVLPGAKIDGVCTWLDDKSPVIGLSTLYDRLDNFWFVLRHEIEHVIQGHGKSTYGRIDYLAGENSSSSGDIEDEEKIANEAAAEFAISQSKLESFYLRKKPYFSERDVIGFASILSVHPAIVVGQLQRRMKRYDYLRKYQVPVRKFLSETAMTDGWSHIVEAKL